MRKVTKLFTAHYHELHHASPAMGVRYLQPGETVEFTRTEVGPKGSAAFFRIDGVQYVADQTVFDAATEPA